MSWPQWCDNRIKSSRAQLIKSLTSNYREEQIFILQQELALYDFYQQQIEALDVQISSRT